MDRLPVACTRDGLPDEPSVPVHCIVESCHAPLRLSVKTVTLMEEGLHVTPAPMCIPCAERSITRETVMEDVPGEGLSREQAMAKRIYWRLRLLGLIGDE